MKKTEYKNKNLYFHRRDGPAIEWANGKREWYINNERHRKDGPAIEQINGDREWWENGKKLEIYDM